MKDAGCWIGVTVTCAVVTGVAGVAGAAGIVGFSVGAVAGFTDVIAMLAEGAGFAGGVPAVWDTGLTVAIAGFAFAKIACGL